MPWLMKAEPDSRIVKGKDVKFSVDDLEEIGVSPWDGVRNHQAKNFMRDGMKVGDQVLFYHSNCKVPGVYALAEVAKEGYPDYTAWDPSHPYHDAKTNKESPTWFMVDVRFVRRLPNPPTLALVKHLAGCSELPACVKYIDESGLAAIKAMQLVNRGRLSVQTVEADAYDAIVKLGDMGGWDDLVGTTAAARKSVANGDATTAPATANANAAESTKPNGRPKRKSSAAHGEQTIVDSHSHDSQESPSAAKSTDRREKRTKR